MWPPLLICHEMQCAENLGAIARLLGNFGCSGCRLSRPFVQDWKKARRVAVNAAELLKEFVVVQSLEEALEDVVYAVGTSFRPVVSGRKALSPEEGMRHLWERHTQGPVALVVGGERRGLSDEELALCQEFICIDTPGTKPSLNLAQAVAICLFLCAQHGAPPREAQVEPRATPARHTGTFGPTSAAHAPCPAVRRLFKPPGPGLYIGRVVAKPRTRQLVSTRSRIVAECTQTHGED